MVRQFNINAPRRGGKTTFAINQLTNYAIEHPESVGLYIGAHRLNADCVQTAAYKKAFNYAPFGLKRMGNQIRFNNGSYIGFVSVQQTTATKAQMCDIIVYDDFDDCSADFINSRECMLPTMKANGTMMYVSTPKQPKDWMKDVS